MTKRFDIQAEIDSLPPGLERALLRTLSKRVGREQAIGREALLVLMRTYGGSVSDRQMRLAINQLRKAGHLICSAGGIDGGYYLPANWEELNDYLGQEVHSRAMDLLEQERAMRQAGEKLWGPDLQIRMF